MDRQKVVPETEIRKIIIVGKIGNGKSSTGNAILDKKNKFKSCRSLDAVTGTCSTAEAFRYEVGKKYVVVDTPGLFDPNTPFAKTAKEIQKGLELCPNPHVFLLVLKSHDRLSQEELLTVDMLRIIFGESFLKHTIVVFTSGAIFKGDEEFTNFWTHTETGKQLMDECGNRVVRVENDSDHAASKVMNILLLASIENLSRQGRNYYNYGSIETHKQVLEDHLKNHQGNVDLLTELKQITEEIHKRLGREKWRNYLIGGAAVVVAGTGGGALYVVGRMAATAVTAVATNPEVVPVVGGVLSLAAGAATKVAGLAFRLFAR